jgi:endonuclease/exonuclease/phosphatase family metal-dependent hydrolase
MKCRRALPLLLVAACDAGAAVEQPDAARPDAAATAPLTVVTLNLRCLIDDWDARLPVLADGLAATGADVFGLQEVCAEPGGRDALEELLAALAARGVDVAVPVRTTTHLAWDTYQEGLAIVSRHPVAEVAIAALPAGALPRKVLAARIDAPGGPVVVATTHLDHQSGEVRAAQAAAAAAVAGGLAGEAPQILVGDLNEAPGGGVDDALAGAGLADVWATLRPDDAGATFPSSAPEVRIDYVWTAGLQARAIAPILDARASDHLGLSATLHL